MGSSDTNNRVEEAVKGALENPLLQIDYQGATGALVHVTGGPDMTLDDINKVGELATDALDDDANVIWGARVDEEMKGRIMVMTIITGVKSPYITGPADARAAAKVAQTQMTDELGIEVLR